MTLSFDIPDDVYKELVAASSAQWNFARNKLSDKETPDQFLTRRVLETMLTLVNTHRADDAAAKAPAVVCVDPTTIKCTIG